MKSNWKKYQLGDLCDTVSDTYRGNDPFVILINTSDVLNGTVLNHSETQNKNLPGQFKKTFKKNDILYSEIRPANKRFAFVDFEDTKKYIASTKLMVIRARENIICPRFLFYILSSQKIIDGLQHLAETRSGTFPQITFSSGIAPIEVCVPDLEVQSKIVSLLENIDRKIRENGLLINNLETQIHLLFSRMYCGLDEKNSFESLLGNDCVCVLGGTPDRKKEEYWNGNIPWINSGEVNNFRITKASEYITQLGFNKSATKLMPKKTTVIAITGATLGQFSLLEIDTCANQSVIGVIPNETLPYEFIYPLIVMKMDEILANQTGGAQQHVNKSDVQKITYRRPNRQVLNGFVISVNPMFEMITNKCFENIKLEEIKNTILPKLINGEIDVE